MKRLLVFISTILLSGSLLMGSHLADSDVKFYDAGDQSIAIYVDSKSSERVQITIRDDDRAIVYDKTYRTDDIFNMKFNLKYLKEGNYTVCVDNGLSISSQPIIIEDGDVLIDQKNESTFFKPSIRHDDNKIDIDLSSFTSQKIKVQIVDYNGRINYRDELEVDGRFQRRFDISKLEAGNYSVYISVFDGYVSHQFEKTIQVKSS